MSKVNAMLEYLFVLNIINLSFIMHLGHIHYHRLLLCKLFVLFKQFLDLNKLLHILYV